MLLAAPKKLLKLCQVSHVRLALSQSAVTCERLEVRCDIRFKPARPSQAQSPKATVRSVEPAAPSKRPGTSRVRKPFPDSTHGITRLSLKGGRSSRMSTLVSEGAMQRGRLAALRQAGLELLKAILARHVNSIRLRWKPRLMLPLSQRRVVQCSSYLVRIPLAGKV